MTLDRRELGTVLAALRLWQATNHGSTVPLSDSQISSIRSIATDAGEVEELGHREIDTLCEKLNLRGGH